MQRLQPRVASRKSHQVARVAIHELCVGFHSPVVQPVLQREVASDQDPVLNAKWCTRDRIGIAGWIDQVLQRSVCESDVEARRGGVALAVAKQQRHGLQAVFSHGGKPLLRDVLETLRCVGVGRVHGNARVLRFVLDLALAQALQELQNA